MSYRRAHVSDLDLDRRKSDELAVRRLRHLFGVVIAARHNSTHGSAQPLAETDGQPGPQRQVERVLCVDELRVVGSRRTRRDQRVELGNAGDQDAVFVDDAVRSQRLPGRQQVVLEVPVLRLLVVGQRERVSERAARQLGQLERCWRQRAGRASELTAVRERYEQASASTSERVRTVVPADRQLGHGDALEEDQQLARTHRVIAKRGRLLQRHM